MSAPTPSLALDSQGIASCLFLSAAKTFRSILWGHSDVRIRNLLIVLNPALSVPSAYASWRADRKFAAALPKNGRSPEDFLASSE